MRTPLTDFSPEFCRSLRSLFASFDGALAEVAAGRDEELGAAVVDELRRVRGRLDGLLATVESRRAYALFFGPLKSGKSTLMNALAGTYVSDVTSMPAHPAPVFVSHAEQPSYGIARHDGTSEPIANATVLRAVVESAHARLAAAVRATEREGRAFDPGSELPDAIRRIEVSLPAEGLELSRVVLVETSGHHSRRKFRYEAAAPDFRHASSVAVFVVKPESLFLEQTSAELTDLLDLFSRVFLVLNVDSSAVDLGPHGELVPSLEQTDPERIVRAFEDLAMDARLREALEEGRLPVYPVDLLRAAAARMPAREGAEAVGGPPEPAEHDARFDRFLRDLTGFLNGNDDLNAFVGDSLTRGEVLLGELEGVCACTAFRDFVVRLDELVRRRNEQSARLRAARELRAVDWEREALSWPAGTAARGPERTNRALAKLGEQVDRALDGWFRSPASLQALIDKSLLPEAAAARRHLRRCVLDDLRARIDGGNGPGEGAEMAAAARNLGGLDLRAIARETLLELTTQFPEGPADEPPIRTAEIPVKRRPEDWLRFKSKQNVRRRLFGSPTSPTEPIEASLKARILGDAGREAMREAIGRHHGEHLCGDLLALERDLLRAFAAGFAKRIGDVLRWEIAGLEPSLAALDEEVEARRGLAASLDALRTALAESRAGLQSLKQRVKPTRRDAGIAPACPAEISATVRGGDDAASAAA